MTEEHRSWDDYYIPGTLVLRNRFTSAEEPFGISDQARLTALEEEITLVRIAELLRDPLDGPLDYPYMKAVHRHIFQDVYDWAGQERTAPSTPMSKDGHQYFPAGPALTARAEELYDGLAEQEELRGLSRTDFLAELAELWGELNVVHSFREGNTRSQVVFFHQLVARTGRTLRIDALARNYELRDRFVRARFHHQDRVETGPLIAVLGEILDG